MKKHIEINPYNILLEVIYCEDEDECNDEESRIYKFWGQKAPGSYDHRATTYSLYKDKKGRTVQSVLFNGPKSFTVSTISHESFHCVMNISRHIELDLCPKSEEAFSYLQGFISQSIYDSLKFMIE